MKAQSFQSFQVRTLKNQIAACLRLIALHVKSAILKLVDLEAKLEAAMSEQILNYNFSDSPEYKKARENLENYYNSLLETKSPRDFTEAELSEYDRLEGLVKYWGEKVHSPQFISRSELRQEESWMRG
jgi:hypothetical protein